MLLKVIACEISARELRYAAARSRNVIDLEFLTQGHHDTPQRGRQEIQARIEAVPSGKYEAIVLGYGLCGNILAGLTSAHTQLVVPRAHDCITLFLGSKERYKKLFSERPGTYYFTSGWLECATRRGHKAATWGAAAMPANSSRNLQAAYQEWARQYGEEQARYLLEEMSRWTQAYSHGSLIDFDFLQHLDLPQTVKKVCAEKGWQYEQIPGDLSLFQKMLDGPWTEREFLLVQPGQQVAVTFDDRIVGVV